MSRKKKDRKIHQVQDSVLVEISTTARVYLEDLEIYPEGMDLNQIKAKLVKEFAEMIEDNDSFKIGAYQVKVLDQTATSRSVPLSKAEESK